MNVAGHAAVPGVPHRGGGGGGGQAGCRGPPQMTNAPAGTAFERNATNADSAKPLASSIDARNRILVLIKPSACGLARISDFN
jgi:hypothetical protein